MNSIVLYLVNDVIQKMMMKTKRAQTNVLKK